MSNKQFLIFGIILLGILIVLPNVMAATTLNNASVTGGNYSRVSFNCTTAIQNVTSYTIYYNGSGGSAKAILFTSGNDTSSDTEFYNASYSLAGFLNTRLYNFTCMVWNGTGSENSTQIINVTIDNTPPAVSFAGTTFVLWGNYSGSSLIINTSINDSLIGMSRVYFNVSNSAGVSSNWSVASNVGGEYTLTFDTTGITTDGTYNVTIYANDTLANLNKTIVFSVKFDNTAPAGTFACTPASVSQGDTVTCSCSGSDATSGVKTTTYTASHATPETGSYTKTCTITDHAGKSYSLSATYVVEGMYGSPGSSSGGSSSTTSATWTKSVPIDATQFESSTGYNNQLAIKNKVTMTINEETHYVGVKSLTATSAVIEIASEPIEITLSVGSEYKRDLNDDDVYDLYLKLNSITNNKANITMKKISEAVPESEQQNNESTAGNSDVSSVSYKWIALIVAGLILIIAVIVLKNKYRR